jgi:hypothetical protein
MRVNIMARHRSAAVPAASEGARLECRAGIRVTSRWRRPDKTGGTPVLPSLRSRHASVAFGHPRIAVITASCVALAALTPCQCGLRHPRIAVITASCVPKGPRECVANEKTERSPHSHPMRRTRRKRVPAIFQTSLNDLDKAEETSKLRSSKSAVFPPVSAPPPPDFGLEKHFMSGWQGG